jgi:hypothetical protein
MPRDRPSASKASHEATAPRAQVLWYGAAPTMTATPSWEPLCEDMGLYHIVKQVITPLRTTALRLRGEQLLIYSPRRDLGDVAHDELGCLGRVRFLLAPNHYHNLGLGEFLARYPGAQVVASAAAMPRLRQRTGLTVAGLDALRSHLPDAVRLIEPPGMKNGEVLLTVRIRRGLAWVAADAFFNLASHPPGAMGLFCRLVGISAGLRIGQTFLWVGPRDRAAYRASLLEELRQAPPTMLLPCHGDLMEDPDLGACLGDLLQRL